MGAISLMLGCDEIGTIWGWVWWCDMRLGAVVRSGVVVHVISTALLSLLALGVFFFWKWFEGKLGDGFWTVG